MFDADPNPADFLFFVIANFQLQLGFHFWPRLKATPTEKFDPSTKAAECFSPSLTGLQQGSSYCGIEQNFLGSFRIQHSASRLLVVVRPADVTSLSEHFFERTRVGAVGGDSGSQRKFRDLNLIQFNYN